MVKLVTNRNFNKNQLRAISDIQSHLKTIKRKISFNTFLKDNPTCTKSLKN